MAKIIGNTTAMPNPRPDWNQTDESKADYIKNKPFEQIDDVMLGTSENPVQNKVIKAYVDHKIGEPLLIDGAKIENFYNPDVADIVEGKYIDPTGAVHDNATYMYFKVKLFSGKKYRINLKNTYSVVVFSDGTTNGVSIYSFQPNATQAFELPEMTDKVVTAYFSCMITQYNNVGGNVIIVKGEELPTGDELYRISYPWLYVPEEEKELIIPPYAIDEVKLKQKMSLYLFDGIECDNYFDVEYMIANSTEDTKYQYYYHTPFIYLPAGTYTINECYSYTFMTKDGVQGEAIRPSGTATSVTFDITEDQPYISFMIYCVGTDMTGNAVKGIEYLRKIAIQKGTSAISNIPSTYRFNEKFKFEINTDTELIQDSQNPVSGGAVYQALQNISIDVDNAVIEGSTNPVSGDAVKTYVDEEILKVTDATGESQVKIDPIYIEGAKVGNFYNVETANIEEGTGYYIEANGQGKSHAQYMYFKVKLFAGNKYRINLPKIYSVVVFENDSIVFEVNKILGNIVYSCAPDTSQEIDLTEINEVNGQVVTVYISCMISQYNAVNQNIIIVEGEELPIGNEKYQISFPWLSRLQDEEQTVNPLSIDGAVVENFYNPNTADIVEGKYIGTNGTESNSSTYMYFKVELFSGQKYRINLKNTYSVVVFSDGTTNGVPIYFFQPNATQAFEVPEMKEKIVIAYISCMTTQYNNINGNIVIVEGEDLPSGNEQYKISLPWLNVPNGDKEENGGVNAENTINQEINPISIEGAKVENFYNPSFADKQEEMFIDYAGKVQTNSDYCVIKVKLFSGKTYRLNAIAYSAAIYEDDNINGVVKHNWLIGSTQKIEIPDTIEDKIVTVFFCFKNTSYIDNLIIVEGEELPKGDELYRITYPWLYIPEEEEEENITLPPYTVNEIALKQKMPPHLFDGIEMDNYFDVEYMIANSTQDTQYTNYYHTPFIYLPAGTYTINECYKYTSMSKDGVKGAELLSGGPSNSVTFTVTEENPYISFMIYCVGLDSTGNSLKGIDYLRKISIQKGETAKAYVPNTYKFNEKFNFKGSVGYYPTHWDNKKFATIGDSITFGTPSGVTPEDGTKITPNFAETVSGNLNMELLNTAQPGATVKDALGVGRSSYNNQVEQIINFAPNVVTIMLGVNDASSATKVPLGTIDDVYDATNVTFYAGLGEIVNQIQTALPSTTIILMSSPKNMVTANMTDYICDAVKKVAEKYNVLFFDLHNVCGFNLNNQAIKNEFAIVAGQVHPNYKAHKVMGSRLTGFIASH